MRTSKRNNNKMESKTQTQHNRKKATRIRVSERDWEKERERAERKVKRARPTKLAKEASSTAVMADETSLPATTTTATIFSNSFHCKRQSREEPAAEEQERKTGQGERGAQHKVVATCCRMFSAYCLLPLWAQCSATLSLSTSPTLFDEWEWRDCDRQCWRERECRSGGLKRVCWEFCCSAIWWVFNW